MYFTGGVGWVEAKIYERYDLPSGFRGDGPAIFEEYGATTLVWPGDRFEIGDLREIRIQCNSGERRAAE